MRKHLLIVFMILLVATGKIAAQNITGTVVDAQKEPIPGVSVVVKGTSIGTATDADGKFELNVPDASGKTLSFMFLGYKTQDQAIGRNTNFSITMQEDIQHLEDVVVVGYGVQKKSLVTGAIAQVSASQIANKQITRLDDALRGMASGVTVIQKSGVPGDAPQIRIRGTSTPRNSDPLYVIDGVVMNGGIDYLNPNDIASIEVMKDAASGAIYGTQAANGVIIITTKKGSLNEPMRININTQMGVQSPVNKVKMANATQYAELMNIAALNDGNSIPFASPTIFGTGTNWQDQIFSNNALYQNHNISVSGGTDKSTYFLSAGYIGQQGLIAPSTTFNDSYSLTTNTSFKLSKYVTIGENLSYTYRKNNTSVNTNSEFGGPLSSALNLDPITPVTVSADDVNSNFNGMYPSKYLNNFVQAPNGMYYAISPYVGQEIDNPLADIKSKNGNYSWSHNLVANGYININPIKGLNLRSQISAKKAFWGNEQTSNMPPYYLGPQHVPSTPQQYRQWWQNMSWNWDNTASYGRQLGLHNFEVMLGTSAMKRNGSNVGATRYNEPVTNWQDAAFNWSIPNLLTDAAGNVTNNSPGYGGEDQIYTLFSYFGRVNYNYDEKYLLTAIVRRDASSKFGANKRWGTFPSAQLGWVVTREGFFPQDTWLNNLKIRLSYGVVGNDMSLDPFQFTSMILSGGNRNAILGNDSYVIGYGPQAPANPNLQWEQTASFDVGFDAVLAKSFTVTFDFYNKKTSNILQQLPIPKFGGSLDNPWVNVGDMKNVGEELELGYQKNLGNGFNLKVNGNISHNQNTVTFLGGGREYIDPPNEWHTSGYALRRMAVGQPIYAFYGFKELGTFKSQAEIDSYGYTDADGIFHLYQPNAKPGDFKWWKNPNNPDGGQGVIGEKDRTFIGDPTPHWMYGLNINLSWKNWDLLAFGQGVWGNQIFQAYRRRDVDLGTVKGAANYQIEALDTWTTLNPNSNYPRISNADANNNFVWPSNFYLQSGAYFRLKTLQLGYTLPKTWMHSIGFQSIRIYGSISNLFTITKYTGFDPEVGGGNSSQVGIDKGIYPQARTYMFGLNLEL